MTHVENLEAIVEAAKRYAEAEQRSNKWWRTPGRLDEFALCQAREAAYKANEAGYELQRVALRHVRVLAGSPFVAE